MLLKSERMQNTTKSKRIPFIFNDESTGSCICLRLDLCMLQVKKYNRYARHIHDRVLSSLKMEGIRLLFCFYEELEQLFDHFFFFFMKTGGERIFSN
jgi:hypothetical protein